MASVDRIGQIHKGEVKVEFTGKNITPFGGIGLFSKFVRKLCIEGSLDNIPGIGACNIGKKIVSIIHGFACGLERPSDTEVLQKDEVFHAVTGQDYPDQTTFSRFLKSCTVKGAAAIEDIGTRKLFRVRNNFRDFLKLTLDLDSHVKTVYGAQQRAKVGYNPKKPGRKSYHPLLCFIGETRDFLMGKFRAGDRYTSTGAVDLLKECLSLIPRHIMQLYLRADSGFFSYDFLKFLVSNHIKYAVVAKLYNTIQGKLGGLDYRDIGRNVAVSEFEHCLTKGKKVLSLRMIVISKEVKGDEQATKKQPRLLELKGYSYQVIATNIREEKPEEVWRFYNGRANVENMIKEAAAGFGMDESPSHWYAGNMTYFYIGMLAYNLMNWFKELVLEQKQHKAMLKRLRNRFILIAAKLVHTGRTSILKLSQNYPWQEEYRKA
ncbi:MAG: IS1380 family transposase, partial [Chloroflexota bacterium]